MIDLSGMKELTIDGVKLRELSVDGTKVWKKGRLPAGYTEREYIRFDGASWLNTRICPSDFPYGLEQITKTRFGGYTGTNTYLYGVIQDMDGTKYRSGNAAYISNLRVITCYMSTQGKNIRSLPTPSSDSPYELYTKILFKDMGNSVLTVNGEPFEGAVAISPMSKIPTNPIYFGWCNGVGSTSLPCKDDGYYHIINGINADGSTFPVLYYVSCTRDSDGAAGMFDLITGRFDGNEGTGTLTAGPAV